MTNTRIVEMFRGLASSALIAVACLPQHRAATQNAAVAPPSLVTADGPQNEVVARTLDSRLAQDARAELESCREEALQRGATADEFNRVLVVDYVIDGMTGEFERLDVSPTSRSEAHYSLCAVDEIRRSGPVPLRKPAQAKYSGQAQLPPSSHCPLGTLGCACSVDDTCFSGSCSVGMCIPARKSDKSARPTKSPTQIRRHGIEVSLGRCDGFGANARVVCALQVRAMVRDMELQVGGTGRGACRNAASMMYDDMNNEHVGQQVTFAGKRDAGCVVARLVHNTSAQILLEFDNVPQSTERVAQLAPHISTREVGMQDWVELAVEFRGVDIGGRPVRPPAMDDHDDR